MVLRVSRIGCLRWNIATFTAFTLLAAAVVLLTQPSIVLPPASALLAHQTWLPVSREVSRAPHTIGLADYFVRYPPKAPYKDVFGELGLRCRLMRDWLEEATRSDPGPIKTALDKAVEATAASHFSFLVQPKGQNDTRGALSALRASFQPGSAGIVIPAGVNNMRFAAQLIHSLRGVLKTDLPIQIVYAGEHDLPRQKREEMRSLIKDVDVDVEMVNILSIFDDKPLRLTEGTWATKPFAALGSSFETVILLDADAVFLQDPRVLLSHPAFVATGTLFFHDRLLWQYAFRERHEWFHQQIQKPSPAMNKSRVWTQRFAEEQDSGVVVVNKARPEVLMGLLHTCWQNSYAVREEVTYKMTYGDKESWWLGFELTGATYEFEQHYGGIVGWEDTNADGSQQVCSFVIAHLDAQERLLWYNGGLLKNKKLSNEYAVPDRWMVDARWEKPGNKSLGSCMVGGQVHNLTQHEMGTLSASIDRAMTVDEMLGITAVWQNVS